MKPAVMCTKSPRRANLVRPSTAKKGKEKEEEKKGNKKKKEEKEEES